MIVWVAGYFAAALAFLGCDAVWLSLTASRLYKSLLGDMVRDDFALLPAVLFYLLYVSGILIFAVAPALGAGKWTGALWRGAVLGLVAYGTYDLTNQATLKGWPTIITIADLCWGMFVTGVGATAGFLVVRWLSARG